MKVTLDISRGTIFLMAVVFVIGVLVGSNVRLYSVPAQSGSQTITQQPQTQGSQPTQPSGPLKFDNPFDDDPVIGDKNAKVIFIEFSDFQCPFCRRFYTQSLTQLEDEYIKTGKVVFVYRDFPLDSIHPGATPYALAAECAEDQGKWREMHNKIFDEQNKQGQGTIEFEGNDKIKQWATDLGLDKKQFDECLDSGKYVQEVQKDFQDGINAGVTGTPTFFIGTKEKGFQTVVGAQPYSTLKQVVEAILASS